jgi:hypothetical protein
VKFLGSFEQIPQANGAVQQAVLGVDVEMDEIGSFFGQRFFGHGYSGNLRRFEGLVKNHRSPLSG